MKRSYIWLICLVVCIAFISLLYLQGRYAKEMIRMRQEQFDENVLRSLDQASRELEKTETYRYLQNVLNAHEPKNSRTFLPDSFRTTGSAMRYQAVMAAPGLPERLITRHSPSFAPRQHDPGFIRTW